MITHITVEDAANLISRIARINETHALTYIREAADRGEIQAADVAPMRHGKWIKPVPGDGENYCSVCHAEQPWFYGYGYYEPDYCPNCGARMDKENNDS